jgi:hypothetical protein
MDLGQSSTLESQRNDYAELKMTNDQMPMTNLRISDFGHCCVVIAT